MGYEELAFNVFVLMVGKVEVPLGPKARIVFFASFRVKAHTHTLTARYVTE